MRKFLSLFRAGSSRRGYSDAADFLRVFSVGLIGWFHIWQQSWLNPNPRIGGVTLDIYPLVSCGYLCVDLMLLLSGFLLMLGFLSRKDFDARTFYRNRAARILPSYLICVFLLLFARALPQKLYPSGTDMLVDLLSHLTFTHNLFPQSTAGTCLNGALWTLAVEVQFYLLFPYLAPVFRRRPVPTYLAMTAFSGIIRLSLALNLTDVSAFMNRLSAMMDVYANGMMAAFILTKLQKTKPGALRAWISTLLALGSLVLIYRLFGLQSHRGDWNSIHEGQLLYRYQLSFYGAVFLVCGSRSVRLFRLLLSNPLIRFLSGISYNFYIWHQYLAVRLKDWHIPGYQSATPNMDSEQPWQNRYTLLCFAAALLTAVALTYCLERPAAKLIKKRLNPKPANAILSSEKDRF